MGLAVRGRAFLGTRTRQEQEAGRVAFGTDACVLWNVVASFGGGFDFLGGPLWPPRLGWLTSLNAPII